MCACNIAGSKASFFDVMRNRYAYKCMNFKGQVCAHHARFLDQAGTGHDLWSHANGDLLLGRLELWNVTDLDNMSKVWSYPDDETFLASAHEAQ